MDKEFYIKIVLVGQDNTGKTIFCQNLLNGYDENLFLKEYISTNGGSYMGKKLIYKNKIFNLDIWDTAGQEKYLSLIKFFFKGAGIVFIFYNSYNIFSFNKAKDLFYYVKENTEKNKCVYALVANKYDLSQNSKEDCNILSEEEVLEFAEENNLIFSHLSILEKYSNGVNELLKKALDEYIEIKNLDIM